MAYTAEISRQNPSCFLFLIDQSGSMSDPFGGEPGRSKADRLAEAINRLLFELIQRCTKGPSPEDVRNYWEVGVIGYGPRVGPALGGRLSGRDLIPIREIADNPARVEERRQVEGTVKFPIWFDPVAQNQTPMCEALRLARSILDPWVRAHPASFPPVIINITDGEATDGDPRPPAEALHQLSTQDGNVLLFNLHLSSKPGAEIIFPEDETGLTDDYARQLFQMSSPLTPYMREVAKSEGYAIGPQARGCVFNASMAAVIKFFDVGTRPKLVG